MADEPQLPSPGDVLAGKYRIERLIGQGGMGAVFAAEHMLLNQRVAVKLLLGELASSGEAQARFMNEARAAARIHGEHVARVLDIGQLATGVPYMVLEYLEGADLAQIRLRRGALSVSEVADYALQALDALAQAHAAGIVHRDLKPANLFLAKRHDGTHVVKVLDFGISKNLTPFGSSPQGITNTRAILGSPEYMSPEQLRTPRGVDARTDIWSMGVILYELLTGAMPFAGEAIGELFMQIMERTPPPVRSLRSDIPAALDAAVARCLVRDPNGRFQNVSELAAVLKPFASEGMRALLAARTSSPGIAVAAALAETIPLESMAGTAPPWSHTEGAPSAATIPGVGRSKVVAIVGVGVFGAIVSVVAIIAAVRAMSPARDAAATAVSEPTTGHTSASAMDVPPAAHEPSIAPHEVPAAPAQSTAVAVHPASPGPSSSVATSPAAVSPLPLPSSRPVALPVAAPQAAAAPPPPAIGAQRNCSPNYYFDKDGTKHFKPECF
jgi:tRNA A-37 threonylcarbamoyl transferase component Bud32